MVLRRETACTALAHQDIKPLPLQAMVIKEESGLLNRRAALPTHRCHNLWQVKVCLMQVTEKSRIAQNVGEKES